MKEIQKKVKEVFIDNFGKTPLKKRMDDIRDETLELIRFADVNNIKEEAGDLLSSVIMLCNECGWDVEDVVNSTLNKINRREKQYKSLGRKYKVALLGGAFNPITSGHIEVAKYVLDTSGVFDEVWLTPAFNHMHNKDMLSFDDRFKMCELAANSDGRIKVFDYEKRKGLAGETYHLLNTLMNDKEYENYNFSFIIGLDNANSFNSWINYEELERLCRFIVVPRKGYEPISGSWYFNNPHIFLNGDSENTPIIKISSTEIRNKMHEYWTLKFKKTVEDDIVEFLNGDVMEYIKEKELYKN